MNTHFFSVLEAKKKRNKLQIKSQNNQLMQLKIHLRCSAGNHLCHRDTREIPTASPFSASLTARLVSHMGCQVLSIDWMCSLAFIRSAAILELRWSTSSMGYFSEYGAAHW